MLSGSHEKMTPIQMDATFMHQVWKEWLSVLIHCRFHVTASLNNAVASPTPQMSTWMDAQPVAQQLPILDTRRHIGQCVSFPILCTAMTLRAVPSPLKVPNHEEIPSFTDKQSKRIRKRWSLASRPAPKAHGFLTATLRFWNLGVRKEGLEFE